jgi:hypothetical protein
MSSVNIETIDDLITKLTAVRAKLGKNVPLNISVLQETKDNPYGSYYEDRDLADNVEIINVGAEQIVELYV